MMAMKGDAAIINFLLETPNIKVTDEMKKKEQEQSLSCPNSYFSEGDSSAPGRPIFNWI